MRFGQWRGLNGNNYYLNMPDIISSEKKIRLLHVLRYKAALDEIRKDQEAIEEPEEREIDGDEILEMGARFYMGGLSTIENVVSSNISLKEAALQIAGGAAARTADKLRCKDCVDFLIVPDSKGKPLDCSFCTQLQRGGLIQPQRIVQKSFAVMDDLVRSILQDNDDQFIKFRKADNQVEYLISLAQLQIKLPAGKYLLKSLSF